MERRERGYLNGNIFQTPNTEKNYDSPYVMPSEEIQDLIQSNRDPVTVYRIDLSAAGEMVIQKAGYHFCGFGSTSAAIKTIDTTAYVAVYINKNNVDPTANPFPAKHARGFSGPFGSLYLSWPAQSGVFMDFVVYHSKQAPWIDGESCT